MLSTFCIPIYIIISLLFSCMFRYIIFCFYFRRLIAMAQRVFKINVIELISIVSICNEN